MKNRKWMAVWLVALSPMFAMSLSTTQGIAIADDAEAAIVGSRWTRDQGLVVHEWGTFTTFSGSDGAFLEFRPLADRASDLPDFVWNRLSATTSNSWFKTNIRAKVRMETPVLYFYTDTPQDIEVQVDFPKGMLTEFYPPVQRMLPELDSKAALGAGERIGNSSLDWGRVTLLPPHVLGPCLLDPERQSQVSSFMEKALLPKDLKDAHYAKARETDSALVFVQAHDKATIGGPSKFETGFAEKFLFYRGVGKFELPIGVSFDVGGQPILRNQCSTKISGAMMLRVSGDRIEASHAFEVIEGEQRLVPEMRTSDKTEVMSQVETMLRAEHLYDKEAAAMVATWEDSWFTEEGTRVLYVVPRAMTDELLPLHLNPQPQQLVRTLVGRLEILRPADESEALQAVAENWTKRQAIAASTNVSVQIPVPQAILKFGRMAEPTLARVASIARDERVRQEAEILLSEIRRQ